MTEVNCFRSKVHCTVKNQIFSSMLHANCIRDQIKNNFFLDFLAQSWFETEKQTAETEGTAADDDQAEGQQPSIPTGSDDDSFCQVCHEPFEQFYNEEKEEWHLRPAVVFEEKNYHPLCLEDHKVSTTIYESSLFKSPINQNIFLSLLLKG